MWLLIIAFYISYRGCPMVPSMSMTSPVARWSCRSCWTRPTKSWWPAASAPTPWTPAWPSWKGNWPASARICWRARSSAPNTRETFERWAWSTETERRLDPRGRPGTTLSRWTKRQYLLEKKGSAKERSDWIFKIYFTTLHCIVLLNASEQQKIGIQWVYSL